MFLLGRYVIDYEKCIGKSLAKSSLSKSQGMKCIIFIFQFFSSRFDIIISEIQSSSNAQSTYGGSDYPNAYRTAASTSKASQQSTQLGAASVCTEPIPVSELIHPYNSVKSKCGEKIFVNLVLIYNIVIGNINSR